MNAMMLLLSEDADSGTDQSPEVLTEEDKSESDYEVDVGFAMVNSEAFWDTYHHRGKGVDFHKVLRALNLYAVRGGYQSFYEALVMEFGKYSRKNEPLYPWDVYHWLAQLGGNKYCSFKPMNNDIVLVHYSHNRITAGHFCSSVFELILSLIYGQNYRSLSLPTYQFGEWNRVLMSDRARNETKHKPNWHIFKIPEIRVSDVLKSNSLYFRILRAGQALRPHLRLDDFEGAYDISGLDEGIFFDVFHCANFPLGFGIEDIRRIRCKASRDAFLDPVVYNSLTNTISGDEYEVTIWRELYCALVGKDIKASREPLTGGLTKDQQNTNARERSWKIYFGDSEEGECFACQSNSTTKSITRNSYCVAKDRAIHQGHIVPACWGNKSDKYWWNMVPLHNTCNQSQSSRHLITQCLQDGKQQLAKTISLKAMEHFLNRKDAIQSIGTNSLIGFVKGFFFLSWDEKIDWNDAKPHLTLSQAEVERLRDKLSQVPF